MRARVLQVPALVLLAFVAMPSNSTFGQAGTTAAGSYERVTGSSNPAVNYFGGMRTRAAVVNAPRRQAPQPHTAPSPPHVKPFSNVYQSPTVTPYLGLDIATGDLGVPNYYAFVRPQLRQQEALAAASGQLHGNQRLRMAGQPATAGGPGTPQFLNTGGYFPTAQ
jgi:hypothetical protein